MKAKTIVKVLALAALLTLCLLMTGCYIPPDEIDGTDNLTVGNNNLPFQTLAPTATVTPQTPTSAPGVTQNTGLNGSGVTVVTAQPGSTVNWDGDWGTTITAAPGQSGGNTAATTKPGTITVVTSAPTATPKATATPAPTSSSLRTGSTGTSVRQLQQRLKDLGYYTGSVDGKFGAGTASAVTAFQSANGLTADGVAGTRTLNKLYSDNAVSASSSGSGSSGGSSSRVTATPKPTATPNLTNARYLTIGSSGSDVKRLQKRLIELGWMSGSADGDYGGATEAAVKAFQKKSGIWNDGIAGPDTQTKLYSSGAVSASSPVSSIGESLKEGMDSSAVRAMQKRLIDLGYLSGSADGSFGAATKAAVIAFQTANNLTADGVAGTATLNKLYSADATAAGSSGGSSGSASGSTVTGNATISSTGYISLREGDKSDAVRKLQETLKNLGYYSGTVDGSYGSGTVAAVTTFQQMNNLTADGVAGPATQRALYGTDSTITYATLREYDEGSAVTNLQYTLYELGYYDGEINGIYGSTTKDAVRAFQINNGVSPVDGIAGNKTLQAMYSSTAVSATADNTVYTTLRSGDTGDPVVELQDMLRQLGYLTAVSGVYDDATVSAVKTFQQYNGLTSDGIAGATTQQTLYGSNPVAYPGY